MSIKDKILRSKAVKAEKDKAVKIAKISMDQQKQHKICRCVPTIIKPLRIFQFFAVLLVYAITIYMIVMDPMPISTIACILLIILSSVYVFALAIVLISYFAGRVTRIIPMTTFSLLGVLFFGVAGVLFIINTYTPFVMQQILAALFCLLAALLFLIDITMVLAFWKRRYLACKCCHSTGEHILLQKDEKPSEIETDMRHDAMTSLSDIRIPRELEAVATPDHTYRKVEYPRRREYVDCSTCVPSLYHLGVAQIQTEPKTMSIVESQTPSTVTKETPIQTLSKCEFCQQQIQLSPDGVPSTYCVQSSPQWSYPAIVQFVRGGVNGMPCCPGCKCAGKAPMQQQQQKQKQQQQQQPKESMERESLTPKEKSNCSEMTSEATQEVANTERGNDDVTRLTTMKPITYTVASFYGPEKRIQTVPDLVYKRKMDTLKIKNAKPTNEDVDRKFTEETILKLTKTRKPETLEETFLEHVKKRRNDDNVEESEEKIERNKGGGEHCFNIYQIYQEFMRAAEQGSVTNLETSMHRSGTLITPSSGRTKARALLHLKSNKVDSIKDANVFDEDCTLEKATNAMTAPNNQAAQEREHLARTESPNLTIEHQLNDACSHCRRQKNLTPTSDNYRCYSVFKDKKGKYFCEFCAPLDSKKITSRLEGMDLRKLRCTNCRLHLRDRSVRTNVKLK